MSEPKSPNKPKSGAAGGAVEVAARTVDEAIARGLVRLGGLSRGEVQIDVLKEGRAGLLGFGAEDALVRLTPLGAGSEQAATKGAPRRERAAGPAPVTAPATAPVAKPAPAAKSEAAAEEPRGRRRRRGRDADPDGAQDTPAVDTPRAAAGATKSAPAPAPAQARASGPAVGATPTPIGAAEGEDATAAASVVALELLHQMGYADATIEIQESLLPNGEDDDIGSAVLCIRGRGTDRLLNEDSAPLNALQFVTRLIVSRRANAWCNVLLDIDGDRRRRVKELLDLANQSAELVESGGKPVSLPPMGAYERRVVHLALREHATVATQSIGSGPYRKVTVRRRDQMLPDM